MTEMLVGKDIDVRFVSSQIPWVMNALYDKESFDSVSLEEIRDAFRLKQIQSKSWMMDKIKILDKTKPVLVIGSWLGFTSLCLRKLGFQNITETDPDARLNKLACHLNRHWPNFIHLNEDVNNIDISKYGIIVNTSCEHIADNTWYDRIVPGTKLVLHSNNLQGYDHVNTCENIHEMLLKYPMDVEYSGCLNLEQYTRFMLIGTKCT